MHLHFTDEKTEAGTERLNTLPTGADPSPTVIPQSREAQAFGKQAWGSMLMASAGACRRWRFHWVPKDATELQSD